MFKLFLEMRKRSNMSMGATAGYLPPRGRAYPSQTVHTRAPYPVVDDVDQRSDGQPGGGGEHSLHVDGQSQAAGQLQVAGQVQAAVQSTLIQTLAQSLVAPVQQDPLPLAEARVHMLAQQAMHTAANPVYSNRGPTQCNSWSPLTTARPSSN